MAFYLDMNCKELMIGDCVLLQSNGVGSDENVKVSGIDEDGLFVSDCDNLICFDEVNPIPLTEEILVKNGFTFTFDSFWSFCKNDFERIMLRFCKDNENEEMTEKTFSFFKNHWIFDENYRIDYVHELQHALRLCGLGEFADNFKVEGGEE